MKRSSMEALEKNHSSENENEDDSNQQADDLQEPGMKRAKMPKKSKHRMRAHINPMGDLTIPV